MNLEEMLPSVDKNIPIYLDKLRVMADGNQDQKVYQWIQDQYPQYKKEYEKILFQRDETYYYEAIERFRDDKRIVFMSDVWGV
jgi:methylase of polypeptide subunit release factors